MRNVDITARNFDITCYVYIVGLRLSGKFTILRCKLIAHAGSVICQTIPADEGVVTVSIVLCFQAILMFAVRDRICLRFSVGIGIFDRVLFYYIIILKVCLNAGGQAGI